MSAVSKSILIIAGGGLGSWLRYVVQGWAQQRLGAGFPYGTLGVNVSGAFIIGLLMTLFLEHLDLPMEWRLFWIVGVLGGYTTFSSLTWEAYQLFAMGSLGLGMVYVLGSVIGGAVAVVAGVWLGRLL